MFQLSLPLFFIAALTATLSSEAQAATCKPAKEWTDPQGVRHWYEYCAIDEEEDKTFSFYSALIGAAGKTKLVEGRLLQGYVVTIGSEAENTILKDVIEPGVGTYTGAGASGSEWFYRNGPEAGQPIPGKSHEKNPGECAQAYPHWRKGEPNGEGLIEVALSVGSNGKHLCWNDTPLQQPATETHAYVVEYSDNYTVRDASRAFISGRSVGPDEEAPFFRCSKEWQKCGPEMRRRLKQPSSLSENEIILGVARDFTERARPAAGSTAVGAAQ